MISVDYCKLAVLRIIVIVFIQVVQTSIGRSGSVLDLTFVSGNKGMQFILPF